jgi:membrane protein
MGTTKEKVLIKAVIFDVDGSLVDSNDSHVEAWQVAFGGLRQRGL